MNISILGATGSIGGQTLDVLRSCLPEARVCGMSGYSNINKLVELVNEFRPEMVAVADDAAAFLLKKSVSQSCEIHTGEEGLLICASLDNTDVVVNALSGRFGLFPTMAAIKAGKNIALANKETLVTAGSLVMEAARKKNVRINPIDSEHSAIYQCLQGNESNPLDKIILTASGGPFRTWPKEKIMKAKAKEALHHPNWKMGKKITIDSATLMNKGLELIEAIWLFGIDSEKIEILVHPQSIIHSMVQFADGAVMAQMGMPDMRIPILYALAGPKRIPNTFPKLDLLSHMLSFEKPDLDKFPCLALALYAAKTGGTLPAVMNSVNEWAVEQYLQNKIGFYGINKLIDKAFLQYIVKPVACPQDILDAEAWAAEFIEKNKSEILIA